MHFGPKQVHRNCAVCPACGARPNVGISRVFAVLVRLESLRGSFRRRPADELLADSADSGVGVACWVRVGQQRWPRMDGPTPSRGVPAPPSPRPSIGNAVGASFVHETRLEGRAHPDEKPALTRLRIPVPFSNISFPGARSSTSPDPAASRSRISRSPRRARCNNIRSFSRLSPI